MSGRTWNSIVTIELKGERKSFARITTTRDAASYLIDQWPGHRDGAYKNAIINCTRALKGEVEDTLAFTTFIQAASLSGLRYMNTPDGTDTIDEFETALIEATNRSLANDSSAYN